VSSKDISVCTRVLYSDLIIKTPLIEQWEEGGRFSPHISQVERGGQAIDGQCDRWSGLDFMS
jgi:hypothetical protein